MNTRMPFHFGVLVLICSLVHLAHGQYGAMPYPPPSQDIQPGYSPLGVPDSVAFASYAPPSHRPPYASGTIGLASYSSRLTDNQNAPNTPIFVENEEGESTVLAPPHDPMFAEPSSGSPQVKSCGCKGECNCCGYSYRVFGEYLLLRSRDVEVAYAVESDLNLGAPPIQVSPIALLDVDDSSGFRGGFGVCLGGGSELTLTYTLFESATSHEITRATPLVTHIESMVLHPATPAATTGTISAAGWYDIDFDLIDLDYRQVWRMDEYGNNLVYVLGARWGSLKQDFRARFTDDLTQPVNTGEVFSDVEFSGAGFHFGLEGERYASRVPMLFYAKGQASLLAGRFDAVYRQTGAQGAADDVNTRWKADRIVPTFELELGTGFHACCGRLRGTVGYVFSVWTNVVKTDDWIHSVQVNDFRDLNDSMTFDGLVTRIEYRY